MESRGAHTAESRNLVLLLCDEACLSRSPMDTLLPKLTYATDGTPGIIARDVTHAYFGLGWLHARHRPVQSWLIHTAARAALASTVAPTRQLVSLDALVRRLGIPEIAETEARRVERRAGAWLDAYLAGFRHGMHERGRAWELRLLAIRARPPDRAAVLGGLLVSAYLGLAQSQERMEHALLAALDAGAESATLEAMFDPHLRGWDPAALRGFGVSSPLGFAAHGLPSGGGSNAWAVDGTRSATGTPLLAGDPHLSFAQMPSLFFEMRARVGTDIWLGATIPGLPGLALGRNRRVAWSGTFGCADNVDFTIERLVGGKQQRGAQDTQSGELALREVELRRRWRRPLRLRFWSTEHGTLVSDNPRDGAVLAVQWAGAQRSAEALAAYMELPGATSAAEAERILQRAHTLSLHYVLADASGDVRYCQAGRIPRRSGGWSGLYPVPAGGEKRWLGFYEGLALPRCGANDGLVASANEARLAPDGAVLSTMPQPPYRLHRIEQLLRARTDHDVDSMQAMHRDVLSLQGLSLRDAFVLALPDGAVRAALRSWDGRYDADSVGAHAFELAYLAALHGLAPALGGDWFRAMLRDSELGTWWAGGLDRLLGSPSIWQGQHGPDLRAALGSVAGKQPAPWGSVQSVRLDHLIFGASPRRLRLHRGPYALAGGRATVSQATLQRYDGVSSVTAPAYRMVADLRDDGLWTSLPGGIDGSPFSTTYDRWLGDYLAGTYHRLTAPADDERQDWQR